MVAPMYSNKVASDRPSQTRTKRARAEGDTGTYSIPTRKEFNIAGGQMWQFTYGRKFRPHWVKSVRSHRQAFPEPVMRYPIDESVYGVYDMCGSAGEWINDWGDKTRGMRWVVLGNWSSGLPDHFSTWGQAYSPRHSGAVVGLRLVYRR